MRPSKVFSGLIAVSMRGQMGRLEISPSSSNRLDDLRIAGDLEANRILGTNSFHQ
jgi:hypothetical protein